MTFRMLCGWLPAVILAAGCAHGPHAGEANLDIPRAQPLDVKAYAARIDPGPAPGIGDALSGAVLDSLKEHAAEHEAKAGALASAQEHRAELPSNYAWTFDNVVHGELNGRHPFVELLEGIYEAERVLKEGDETKTPIARELLESFYWEVNLAARVVKTSATIASSENKLLGGDVAPQNELIGQFSDLTAHSERLALHTSAAVLRDSRSVQALVTALEHLAMHEEQARRWDTALLLREERERRLPENTESHWLRLALLYHRALDVPRGRVAASRAPTADTSDDTAKLRKRVARSENAATTALELKSAKGFEEQLRFAHATLDLLRLDEADPRYQELFKSYPNDARVLTGVVLCDLLLGNQGWGVDRLIANFKFLDLPGLDHRDREYTELTVGLAGLTLAGRVALASNQAGAHPLDEGKSGLEKLRSLSEALQEFNPGRGTALTYLAALGIELLPDIASPSFEGAYKRLATCLDEALPRARLFPDSMEWAKVVTTCAYFAPDVDRALTVIQAPLSEDLRRNALLLRQRVDVALGLVAGHERKDRLDLLDTMAGELRKASPEKNADLSALEGDLASIRALLSHDERARVRALTQYGSALEIGAKPNDRSRILTNIGVWMSILGHKPEAQNAWETAINVFPEQAAHARFLLAVVQADQGSTEAESTLEKLTALETKDQAQQWLGWRLEFARRHKNKALVKTLTARLLERRKDETELKGHAGFVLRNNLQVAFEWRVDSEDARASFPLLLSTRPDVLLILPAPLSWADVEKLAK